MNDEIIRELLHALSVELKTATNRKNDGKRFVSERNFFGSRKVVE